MIEFKNVSKAYAQKKILDHANFKIESRDFFVLVGPSGSGKTTTLKMINQLISQTEGQILIDGQDTKTVDLRQLRLSIGYVLQQIALFPNLTVAENIELIPEMKGWDKKKRQARSRELMELVGLDPEVYAQRIPIELSGGEQQRVGILRAIASEPNIVLMDEPFSALDPISRRQLQIFIKDLQKKLQLTIVFVTHDLNEALLLADCVAIMNDGLIQQIDKPSEIFHHPANKFVAHFFQEYHQDLSQSQVSDLHLTEQTSDYSLKEVSADLSISDLINELAQEKVIRFGNYIITSDDIVRFLAGASAV
ncbi:ATP-binding cassette domain-containing protein [Lactovum miscens]|uniref:ABC-type quaternary amine transporter n=1 Tax=Lactovum miscens TaxID=190387 RepID=A0A841C0U3_9LACT|nr:osmoprotectant transport system ATP-binding protein [Lactovum miscens]